MILNGQDVVRAMAIGKACGPGRTHGVAHAVDAVVVNLRLIGVAIGALRGRNRIGLASQPACRGAPEPADPTPSPIRRTIRTQALTEARRGIAGSRVMHRRRCSEGRVPVHNDGCCSR
jgi:hypothetical protein